MTLAQKALWTSLTFSTAFIFISLLNEDLRPHRFLFGIPLTIAIFVAAGSLSLLSGNTFLRSVADLASENTVRRIWWGTSVGMFFRCILGSSANSEAARIHENTVSLLFCSITAFFMLIDANQRSRHWPKFDVPELGGLPPAKPREISQMMSASQWSWFGILSCLLAVAGTVRLVSGFNVCLDDRDLNELFFLSELGVGKRSSVFTETLMTFGALLVPFFLNFLVGSRADLSAEALKFFAGGCMAICGIIGIGTWNLHHPMHYLSIAVWLWPLATILDCHVPTTSGLLRLRFPTWVVKASMVAYIVSMTALPFSEDGRSSCIISQRIVVLTTLSWLSVLWAVKTTEAFGLLDRLNRPST